MTIRPPENGLRKWLLMIVTTLGLSWVGWVSAAVVESKQAVARAEDFSARLDRIENKLDQILSR